jgi:hypothetical protein
VERVGTACAAYSAISRQISAICSRCRASKGWEIVAMYRFSIASTACQYKAMVRTAKQVRSKRFFIIAVTYVALNSAPKLVAKK